MKFLLDVNVGRRIAAALEANGHDVVRMALINQAAEDPDVLALAVAQERILVTFDRDFGELIFSREAPIPPAVIFLRYRPRDVLAAIERLLPLLDFDALRGHMTIIDPVRVRRTPFPIESNDNG